MIQCEGCGTCLGRSPILLASEMKGYVGPWTYWCARCGITKDEEDE